MDSGSGTGIGISSSQGKHPDETKIDIGKPCIDKVPTRLRKINEAAYTPQVISIGPLHHESVGCQVLAAMKPHKKRYKENFCQRDPEAAANRSEETSTDREKNCMQLIKDNLEEIKRCYADQTIELHDDEFSEMVLLDAAFIIELFLKSEDSRRDYLIENPWMSNAIRQDLILLENQLPYFILDELYKIAFPKAMQNFINLVWNYFSIYIDKPPKCDSLKTEKSGSDCFSLLYCCARCRPPVEVKLKEDSLSSSYEHFTHFVWRKRSKVKKANPNNAEESYYRPIPATKLHKAGVEFYVSPKNWPFNVKYAGGNLIMPPFIVDDNTECLYRNLMAFEQLHCPQEAYFCNYITLMNHLIDTSDDVDFLVERSVISHRLGDNEALSDLVNDLGKEIVDVHKDNSYNAIFKVLEEHYKNGCFGWVAFMREVYFSNCWKGTATIAGLIFLFLTLITSIYSIISIF